MRKLVPGQIRAIIGLAPIYYSYSGPMRKVAFLSHWLHENRIPVSWRHAQRILFSNVAKRHLQNHKKPVKS